MTSDSHSLDRALRALREAPERGLSQPCYLDSGFFELERQSVFSPSWHAIARSDALPNTGDYRSLELQGEPLLLVRDELRNLRAYSRVCLHRAHPIVEGAGNTRRFVCPYHRWTYDLEGQLCGAPLMDGVAGFDKEQSRLPEVRLEEWQGFVLVNLAASPEPLAPTVAALDEKLAPWRFAELRHAGTLDFESPWNWKVMVENFMESYHHLGPHAKTLHQTHPAQGTHLAESDGDFALLENRAVGDSPPFWVAHVFPTLLFSLQRSTEPFGTWFEMQFDGPESLHLRIHLLLPASVAADEEKVAAYHSAMDLIHREDIPVCEGVQRGLRAQLWRPGRLSRQEDALARFRRYLAGRVAGITIPLTPAPPTAPR